MGTALTLTHTTCRCSHGKDAHEHFRPGSECSLCPSGACARYRRGWSVLRGGTDATAAVGDRELARTA